MIDAKWIGHQFPAFRWEVEKGRVRFFCKTIGELRPEYHDEAAARAAGYESLLAPPTFLFSGPTDNGSTELLLSTLGIDMRNILHGEQSFEYHAPVCAGDALDFAAQITGIVAKKGGKLELVTEETRVTNQHRQHVATLRKVVAVVNR
jgi:acyl dehydratase